MHRRTEYRILLLWACSFLWISAASAQDMVSRDRGYDWQVNDARCRGMGRACVSTTEGPAALFYSPGRLGLASRPTIEVGVSGYTGWIHDSRWDPTEYFSGDANFQWYPTLTHIAVTSPVAFFRNQMALCAGIGYNSYIAFGSKMKRMRELRSSSYEATGVNEGGLNGLTFGIALANSERLAAGLSVAKAVTSRVSTRSEYIYNPPQRYTIFQSRVSGDASAMFVTIGVTAKLTEYFDASAAFRPQFKYTVSDREVLTIIDGFVSGRLPLPESVRTIPSRLTVGGSCLIHPQLLAAADIKADFFSQIPDGDLSDGYSLRVGMEWLSRYPVRVGAFRDAIIVSDDNNLVNEVEYGLTIGAKAGGGHYHADFFGEYAFWNHDYLFGLWSKRELEAGRSNNFKYREYTITFGFTLSYSLK